MQIRYQIGCNRGDIHNMPSSYDQGTPFGLLDADTWNMWVRFNQRTSIQKELAERIGKIWHEAGFDFIYFDGAEDVHQPYWFYTSMAQYELYKQLDPAPVFSEGALRSHFGWHILSRGNAFDIFRPEVVKEATRSHPLAEAKIVVNDFTSIDFGWVDYVAPSEKTMGMQPDMYEYICSRGAAWDCPISIYGRLDQMEAHPRTDDNFEVTRRWENARIQGFFTKEQKDELKNPNQEHILLINEKGNFELLPHTQVMNIGNGNNNIRAFIFSRKNKTWVVFDLSQKEVLELFSKVKTYQSHN